MQEYLKIVGNGRRTMRDLTSEEAEAACTLIMTGQASLSQVAAFMSALRIKEESALELTTFTRVVRRYTQQLNSAPAYAIDICVPYDGRSKMPVLLVAASMIAAACGASVGLHGRTGQTTPPKFGVGVGDVLAALGVPVDLSLAAAGEMLARNGLAYVASAQFAPHLETFSQVRLDFGMRSFFNTVEKLLNPFNAPTALVGIFHYPVMQRVLESVRQLDYVRGLAVQGPEGSIEALPSRRTPILEFTPGDALLAEWAVDPQTWNWWETAPTEMPALTADAQARLTVDILDPAAGAPAYYQHGAAMTAALMLYSAGLAKTLSDGLQQAQDALRSGTANSRLQLVQEETYHA
jgi:anthranilate phosphoribosyltransferase